MAQFTRAMNKYDLVVIGAGPSGYAAAMRSLDFKKKTLIIERNRVGGAGITNGALSSKTWWELSREAAAFRKSLKRYNIPVPSINYSEIQAEVRRAVQERKGLLEEQMSQLRLSKDHLFEFKAGEARVLDKNTIEITKGAQKEKVWGEHVVLATGSRPRYLPELPIDEKVVMKPQ